MIDRARSFERVAEDYEAARPAYPAAILDLLPLGSVAEVLDLGAGTGKLTRVLAERYRRVVAVEPLDGMRAILETVVPNAESLAGSAERIPLSDASVDAVFAAQAFHWFANDDAVGEIARVLRPGGLFVVVWNEPDPHTPSPLPAAYRARLAALDPPAPAEPPGPDDWLATIRRAPFEEVQTAIASHEQVQDREGVLGFARSVSVVAHRPAAERAMILSELAALLPEGAYRFAIRTTARWAVRK